MLKKTVASRCAQRKTLRILKLMWPLNFVEDNLVMILNATILIIHLRNPRRKS